MKKREEYIEAVRNYSLYSNKQRNILAALIESAIQDIATISPRVLSEVTGATQPVVYKAIKRFIEDGIMESLNTKTGKLGVFKIYTIKLDEIEEIHEKTKNLKNK